MANGGRTLAAVLLFCGPAVGGTEVSLSGQVRPRLEFREPVGPGHDSFTTMRVRLAAKATAERNVRAFVQLQDVRTWGEETHTLTDYRADNLDLHQGYLEFDEVGGSRVDVRIGRQEVSLGGQRLVGPVDWAQQGRALDGLRTTGRPGSGRLDLFAFRLGDATATNAQAGNSYFAGVYLTTPVREKTSVDVYTLYNRTAVPSSLDTDQYTFGARLEGKVRAPYRLEASYQAGSRSGRDVSAFMLAGRVGAALGSRMDLTLWYDYLSGDGETADPSIQVFDTILATNHKYYGYADLFLDIPTHTGGLGLQDAAVKAALRAGKDVGLNLDLHAFRAAKKGALGSPRLAEELDLTASYTYTKTARIVGGFSYVIAADGLRAIRGFSGDVKFGYVMVDVSF